MTSSDAGRAAAVRTEAGGGKTCEEGVDLFGDAEVDFRPVLDCCCCC